ncbi:ubiquitin-activating enzyme e1 family protein [Cyclospora cayetanensis]|uniref:Ubiquitin-activating enzyme e1 family protein n=1 Tax=Cyclospora cayetanensis TaxID=88456 RepID=A0A1D3D4M3_9EIME|nr:ubiquitin-activating enzyme e1 family protein [Cyclospora cayetanensis]
MAEGARGDGALPQIDTDLYSRQIGAFGMEAMGKLMQLRVLITGLNGQGVECGRRLPQHLAAWILACREVQLAMTTA